ncbi:MAG: hypothetical protein E7455_05630 [Ruminococcaceae bacterium]|nr:hypothetical protein [Oscillospiraceae bacterium]
MYHFTIPMALMDFIPVIFFAITAVILLCDFYNKIGKCAYTLLAAGSVNVFMAGFCKALWKLLYAANICDFTLLEKMFLPVNSVGLLMVGIAMVLMLCKKSKVALSVAVPPVFTGSIVFIIMMVLGLGGMCAALSILAAKMKKAPVMILFILSFVCAMAMGYMSGQDSALAWVNWVEQSINTVSQGLLMLGTIVLHKAGLKD